MTRLQSLLIAVMIMGGVSLPALALPVIPEDASGDRVDFAALRAAIEDLSYRFPTGYAQGVAYLERLQRLEKEGANNPSMFEQVRALQREALIANPLVSGQPLLFVMRPQYKSDHHNTATIFQTGEINTGSFEGGAALKTIDFGNGGAVTTLIDLPEGMVRDPEVHFDGRRMLVSMRRNVNDDYHIYEMGCDGSDLRQLTGAPGVADIDPLYLADDHIAFSSTREPKFCMCNRHIMANLFRMEPDGANIHQIGKSTLFEGHGTLTPAGRILYYRWEYVDRNFGDAQALWTMNPDGTHQAVYWGNNTNSPGGVIDARPIPGTQQVVCIFGSCHDRPWGAVAILDRREGLDGRDGVVHLWPRKAYDLIGVGDFDTFKQVETKYEDPWPLNDAYFLVSRMTGNGEQMGIYLIDTFGNEILLHKEGAGCFDPMPIAARPRPTLIPELRDYENESGTFFVADVYTGTHMKGVERGTVKALRIVESPEKRTWTTPSWDGQGQAAPAMNWHDFNNKRILGTVPVHEDGSAFFTVPSGTFVYFQLLDEDGMMVQSMRSGTVAQPGEVMSCMGCHDDRRSAPAAVPYKTAMALQNAPSSPADWYGPARAFNYREEVQPVFDEHCVSCHDYGNAEGGLVLAGDRSLTFNASYNELWRKEFVKVPGAGPAEIQEAYSWGSHVSKLVQVVRAGHYDIRLSGEDFDRIVTWVDINAPYYPSYSSAFPQNLAGRAPLTGDQLKRLGELTGLDFLKMAGFRTNQGPQVSFDRPELSPCLNRIDVADTAKRDEALAIIRVGQAQLVVRPRGDMAGFEACPADQQREAKYAQRLKIEEASRRALREGRKLYDVQRHDIASGAAPLAARVLP